MRILLITKMYPYYPGQSRKDMTYALHYFVQDWLREGHKVEVVQISPEYPYIISRLIGKKSRRIKSTCHIDYVKVNRCQIHKIPKLDYLNNDIKKLYKNVLNVIDMDNKPDIILCHGFNPGLYIGKKLKLKLNIPLVLTLHKTDINNLLHIERRRTKFKKLICNVDDIGFRSQALHDKFQVLNIRNNEGFIIPSGIENKLIMSEEKISMQSQSLTIFTAAKMVKDKNIDILLHAFSKCVRLYSTLKLKIAGDGPEKKKILNLIDKLSIKENTELLGYIPREEVMTYMEESEIFAMVSSNETFGLVYLEAMAKGCITIGSKNEGIDGIIQSGYNGFLCKPKDVNELETTLLKIISMNIDKKNEIINNSLDTSKKYTQIKMSKKYLRILEDVIEREKNLKK